MKNLSANHYRTLVVLITFTLNMLNGQNSYTFKTAGATGNLGPNQAQLDSTYASTNLSGTKSVSGIQSFTIPVSGKGFDFRKVTQNTERELIISALRECEGFHTRAAKILNIKVRSLRYLIEKYKIDCKNL